MVVHGHCQHPLRLFLPDHIVVEDIVDLLRSDQRATFERGGSFQLLFDDLRAEINAFIADVDARPGDQLSYLSLRFTAERAQQLLAGVGRPAH